MPVDDDDWVVEKGGKPTPPAATDARDDALESAAADWSESSIDEKCPLPARAPLRSSSRSTWITLASVLIVVVAVVSVVRFVLRPERERRTDPNPPASSSAAIVVSSSAGVAAAPAAPVAAGSRTCGVALPTIVGDFRDASRCVPVSAVHVSASLDKKLGGWRMCTIDVDVKPVVKALVDDKGALRGAALLFAPGESTKSVADLFPADVGFGALYQAADKPIASSEAAVVAEADCNRTTFAVHAICPRAMLQWTVAHGTRVANPAPWPGCRLRTVFAFNDAP